MLKRLPVFIIFLLFFTTALAQSNADSVAKRTAVDTTIKHPAADTVSKSTAVDNTIIKALRDSIAKMQTVDSAKHQPVEKVVQYQPVDTVVKHPKTDSVVNHPSADTVATHVAKVDTVRAHPKVDSLADSPAVKGKPDTLARQWRADSLAATHHADSLAKQTKVDSLTKPNPVVDNVPKPLTVDSVARSVAEVAKTPLVKSDVKPSVPAVVIKHSPIKGLSDNRYNAYLKGDDLDSMALVGEMNHYPLPDKALKYKTQIGLNPGQITKLKELAANLHRKRIEMGDNMIRNEKMLDSLFHSKQIVDGTLIFYTNRSGLYYGELKGAILMACYETQRILSDDQVKKLEALEKNN